MDDTLDVTNNVRLGCSDSVHGASRGFAQIFVQ
jgi:hypothetical protein